MEQKQRLINQKSALKYQHSDRISARRKALFPTNDNNTNDLGLISPLRDNADIFGKLDCYFPEADSLINNSLLKSTPTVSNNTNMSPLCISPMQTLITSPLLCSPEPHDVHNDTPVKDSPTRTLKTPHDTSYSSLTIPRLVRKTNLESSFESDASIRNSSPLSPNKQKLDSSFTKNPKVRTALFPELDISLSTKSFYPKSDGNRAKLLKIDCNTESKKKKRKQNRQTKVKRRFGQINTGVRHGIKKPKKSKPTKSALLKTALNIIENSTLNAYMEDLEGLKQVNNENRIERHLNKVPVINVTNDDVRERSPSPDPNKKFFKSSKPKGVFTVNKNIKLEIRKGKMILLDSKKKKHKSRMQMDTSDLCETEQILPDNVISDIIKTLDNKENNQANQIERANVANERKRKISEDLPQSPNVLLSPTSQMCDMASGLAINSPKRAKLDINKFLSNVPENTSVLNVFNKVSPPLEMEKRALFPIFYSSSKLQERKVVPCNKEPVIKKWKSLAPDQMLLDAGQKKFGATQCPECQIVYHMGDPGDELMHLNYHNAGNVLRFNGWKNENVVGNFLNDKVIKVCPGDSKVWWKKVKDLLELVNRDLGFYEMEVNTDNIMVLLYIKNKCIVGCVVAESKSTAYKMLSTVEEIDICTEESFPVKCGVSRIWVSHSHRKEGIGTALMNCLRFNFMFGHALLNEDIALSSPTEMGKKFARSYFKTPNYLIYTS